GRFAVGSIALHEEQADRGVLAAGGADHHEPAIGGGGPRFHRALDEYRSVGRRAARIDPYRNVRTVGPVRRAAVHGELSDEQKREHDAPAVHALTAPAGERTHVDRAASAAARPRHGRLPPPIP